MRAATYSRRASYSGVSVGDSVPPAERLEQLELVREAVAERALDVLGDVVVVLAGQRPAVADHVANGGITFAGS